MSKRKKKEKKVNMVKVDTIKQQKNFKKTRYATHINNIFALKERYREITKCWIRCEGLLSKSLRF